MNQLPSDLKNYHPSAFLDMDATERAWASVAVIVLIVLADLMGWWV
jgi:hypothetical protein